MRFFATRCFSSLLSGAKYHCRDELLAHGVPAERLPGFPRWMPLSHYIDGTWASVELDRVIPLAFGLGSENCSATIKLSVEALKFCRTKMLWAGLSIPVDV